MSVESTAAHFVPCTYSKVCLQVVLQRKLPNTRCNKQKVLVFWEDRGGGAV